MPPPLTTILVGVVLAWVVFTFVSALLSRRLLTVVVKDGSVVRAAGKVPSDFYAEVVDVLERAKASGRADFKMSQGKPVLVTSGDLGADVAQRLRNVVGRFPVAKLKAGRPVRHRAKA
ncbi:MAG: DUF3634 family protein [Polyangiaceae bacterium]|jgi:hypothetical protein|nr:DUF3634 family protein [Polyangiaceae bacterium]MBK8939565.1 DUF3634 family protein [Polyangiaceae bacterium]